MLLSPDDYRFTLNEVVRDDQVAATNLRNYMARGTIKVGQKHKLGRWLFSLADIIRIRVVQQMTKLADTPPADADVYASMVVDRFRYLVGVNEFGELPLLSEVRAFSRRGRQRIYVIAGFSERVVLQGILNDQGIPVFEDRGHGLGAWTFERDIRDSIHLTLPSDEMIATAVMRYTISAVEEETGEDWRLIDIGDGNGADWDDKGFSNQHTLEAMRIWYEKHTPAPTFSEKIAKKLSDGPAMDSIVQDVVATITESAPDEG